MPLAAAATALVIPDADVVGQIAIETHQAADSTVDKVQSKISCKDGAILSAEEALSSLYGAAKDTLDDAIEWASEHLQAASDKLQEEYVDAESWLSADENEWPEDRPPHRKPGHRRPRRPRHPHHRKPNQTVYELISKSKYTTKLAALINEDSDLVDLLNGTSANFTIFAPTDKAFEKIPDHAKKPSKEIIKKVLSYHISSDFYPAGRVLVTRTVPTLLEGEYLSEDPKSTPQRISTNVGFRGLTVNYYSRIVAIDIFGTNGVIHGVDSILIPPPATAQIISFLPTQFSTLELGLVKTGLYDLVNDTSNHLGGTFFAPSNFAFRKLGPRINAFLFSKYGQKYLAALLKYHVVANSTLYSDAIYTASKSDEEASSVPKGRFHVCGFLLYANSN